MRILAFWNFKADSKWVCFEVDQRLTMEKAMATHSSTFAWKIPWTEKPGRLQSMRSLRAGHDWATSLSLSTFMHWRRKWQLTSLFLPGESQGQRSLSGLPFMGSRGVGHDWSDLAAAAYYLRKQTYMKTKSQFNALLLVHFFLCQEWE